MYGSICVFLWNNINTISKTSTVGTHEIIPNILLKRILLVLEYPPIRNVEQFHGCPDGSIIFIPHKFQYTKSTYNDKHIGCWKFQTIERANCDLRAHFFACEK